MSSTATLREGGVAVGVASSHSASTAAAASRARDNRAAASSPPHPSECAFLLWRLLNRSPQDGQTLQPCTVGVRGARSPSGNEALAEPELELERELDVELLPSWLTLVSKK